jgi:hypothetical protein
VAGALETDYCRGTSHLLRDANRSPKSPRRKRTDRQHAYDAGALPAAEVVLHLQLTTARALRAPQ